MIVRRYIGWTMITRVVATLLLLTQLGFLTAPVLAEAGPMAQSGKAHCHAPTTHADSGVAPDSDDCDACDMPACPGMASCAPVGIAIISLFTLDMIPTAEITTVPGVGAGLANLLSTPLPPPPKP